MARPRVTGDRNRRLFEKCSNFKAVFSKHRRSDGELESKQIQGAPCVIAHTYRALISAVGYFKYNHPTPLLLRGQTACFGLMHASLHRAAPFPSDANIEAFLRRYRKALNVDTTSVSKLSTEPLLQHYGIRTRWLDVVDSVPHALFFATHQLVKSPLKTGHLTYVPSRAEYGILYLLDAGALTATRRNGATVHGCWRGSQGIDLVDLRKLKPSLALRPHAQHGLLLRDTAGRVDLWDRLLARIAVPTASARQWISSTAFAPEEFFPHRTWDGVFGHLLSPKFSKFLAAENVSGAWGDIMRFDFHDT